jgi:hypothetical protein
MIVPYYYFTKNKNYHIIYIFYMSVQEGGEGFELVTYISLDVVLID